MRTPILSALSLFFTIGIQQSSCFQIIQSSRNIIHKVPSNDSNQFCRKSATLIAKNNRLNTVHHLSQSNNDDSNSNSNKAKSKGVYSRPSAAIEKGSGFFIPGLEGSRVRVLFGIVVLILNYVNHVLSSSSSGYNEVAASNLVLSEKIATFYGIFILLQGMIEFAKERGLGFDDVSISSNRSDTSGNISTQNTSEMSSGLEQNISESLKARGNIIAEATSWAAASYVALTPATTFMILEENENGKGTILYSLGFSSEKENDVGVQKGILSAIETVHQSKGGRVSIPMDHPAALHLLPEDKRRCVLLQQIKQDSDEAISKKRSCLLVGSDQLLGTFTKNDLKWLGSLSKYLNAKQKTL
mmetsp:Transcript_25838/g.31858  ORF Transcript_25838/g.31858 Transcript_25838/m.31858 type:complete len:357 (+) Transcript_25838:172-1242(+)